MTITLPLILLAAASGIVLIAHIAVTIAIDRAEAGR
jgi:hypothetical protein